MGNQTIVNVGDNSIIIQIGNQTEKRISFDERASEIADRLGGDLPSFILELEKLASKTFNEKLEELLSSLFNFTISKGRFLTFVPQSNSEGFWGRKEDLENLHSRICSTKRGMVLLMGARGIGKTALILNYICSPEFSNEYDNIGYLEISDDLRKEVILGFSDSDLDFSSTANSSQDGNLQELKRCLKGKKGTNLVILDGKIDKKDLGWVDRFFANSGWQLVLVGSFPIADSEYKNRHLLQPLKAKHRKKLFDKLSKKRYPQADIESILQITGGNTLLICMIAKLSNEPTGCEDLIALKGKIQQSGLLVSDLNLEVDISGFGEQFVSQIINTIFNLSGFTYEEKLVLSVLLYMPEKFFALGSVQKLFQIELSLRNELNIFKVIISSRFRAGELGKGLRKSLASTLKYRRTKRIVIDSFRLKKICESLTEKGWLIKESRKYKVHSIVRLSLARVLVKESSRETYFLLRIAEVVKRTLETDFSTAYFWAEVGPSISTRFHDNSFNYLALKSRIGVVLEKVGYLSIAEKLHTEVLNKVTAIPLPRNRYLIQLEAMSYNNLSAIPAMLNDIRKAEPLAQKALEKFKSINHPSLEAKESYLTLLNNIAILFRKKGKAKKAIEVYMDCLSSFRKKPEKRSFTFLVLILANLGGAYITIEQYKKSNESLTEAFDIFQKYNAKGLMKSPNQFEAVIFHNFAVLNMKQGLFKKAEKAIQYAIDIRLNLYDENHPYVLDSLSTQQAIISRSGVIQDIPWYKYRQVRIRKPKRRRGKKGKPPEPPSPT